MPDEVFGLADAIRLKLPWAEVFGPNERIPKEVLRLEGPGLAVFGTAVTVAVDNYGKVTVRPLGTMYEGECMARIYGHPHVCEGAPTLWMQDDKETTPAGRREPNDG
jgi:hypothetical protein